MCKTVTFHGFQAPKVLSTAFYSFSAVPVVHSGPSFLCPVSHYSFSFCSLCIFFSFSSYILFSLSQLSHSAQNAGLHCFFLILPNHSTIPLYLLNKGNPGHTDIACKSPCKLRYGKYSEQNKQQWQWEQSEYASFFSSSVTSFQPIILRF